MQLSAMVDVDHENGSEDVVEFMEEVLQRFGHFLENSDWDQAIGLLDRENQDNENLCARQRKLMGGVLLMEASSNSSSPLELFEVCILRFGVDSLFYQDDSLRTPLHAVVSNMERPDLCQFLVNHAPSLIEIRDHGGLRAVDILTQRLIMKEEVLRYIPEQSAHCSELHDCWECARILCLCHGRNSPFYDKDLPILHACCLNNSNVPLSLIQRSLRRDSKLLTTRDPKHGNTPLHIVASFAQDLNDENGEDSEMEEEEDLLQEILPACPSAATFTNFSHQYPLDIAIKAGRRWNSGCRALLMAHPAALEHHITFTKEILYLLVTERIHRYPDTGVPSIIFHLLRMSPNDVCKEST